MCYAEKTHGEWLLPYLSKVKSGQQILGSYIKRKMADKLGLPQSKIFHVSLQSCFDRKLEASRNDFYDEMNESHDVDLVITPGNLLIGLCHMFTCNQCLRRFSGWYTNKRSKFLVNMKKSRYLRVCACTLELSSAYILAMSEKLIL